MKTFRLENMTKGWFVGKFEPTALSTDGFEVAVKHYKAGESEEKHMHKLATEITVVVSGRVRMCDLEWDAGSIILLEPGEITDFMAITDAVNVVVKTPSVINDKYFVSSLQ